MNAHPNVKLQLFATHYTGVLISDDLKELAINRDLTPGMGESAAIPASFISEK